MCQQKIPIRVYTTLYTDILCRQVNNSVPHEKSATTFFFEEEGEQYEELNLEENKFMHASDCVEFLDS